MEPDDNTITFKSQLRHYLEASGMNASQLSRKSGVPRQTVANWLMGMTPKNIPQIKKVADVFKVSLDQLLLERRTRKVRGAKRWRTFRTAVLRFG